MNKLFQKQNNYNLNNKYNQIILKNKKSKVVWIIKYNLVIFKITL